MRTGIVVEVSAADRERLAAIVADRNAAQKAAQKHVWRAHIVLLTADGCGTAEIMRRAGTSKTAVWRWQKRFMTEGVEGLLRDKTRPSRIPPLAAAVEQSVVARTLAGPPGETTHWTATAMARESGIGVSSVQRIWRRHGLRPHRVRQFKLSNDRQFASKLRDIVGLYVDPPAQIHETHTRAQIATFLRRCAVFFQSFQRAVELAKSSYAEEAWSLLTPSERSAAICRELRVLEAQAVKDGSSTPAPRPRRRSSRRGSLPY